MYDFNVFDELEHKQIEENGGVPEQVHENLKGSIRLFSLIGNCMELFIPKFFGTFNAFLGDDRLEEKE
ncbi:MAG TPA: hypothetical protein PLC76_06320 [Saprospiraceae bacterium]|jgi:hypothetical protein|nr:hypothetical protein [Saprospiraceae bacterium]MCB0592165.1 hypothetical protein [Saprospiraceae bacterium]MCO5283066.1 hypothetical protein [Saprospiraceae bacterium]MCO6469780.1 hypothetical protein [Saprospiraceae bacterium]HMY85429.1 hypothetical protein [Saprospiraceae bacterium]